jgi:hypothetical protein
VDPVRCDDGLLLPRGLSVDVDVHVLPDGAALVEHPTGDAGTGVLERDERFPDRGSRDRDLACSCELRQRGAKQNLRHGTILVGLAATVDPT